MTATAQKGDAMPGPDKKRTIVFVDDEKRVLEGLRNRLRKQRKRWDMHFLQSGAEALEFLKRQPADVLVSDMRMPEMDGAELLAAVQQHYTNTVRVVLSGHAELEAAMRVIPVAHQFLTKPCDADELEDVVERACNLQQFLGQSAIQSVVSGIRSLPAVPQTYHQLVKVIADVNSSAKDVADLIAKDVAICSKILQVVNSPLFASRRPTVDIQQAVTRLGFDTIKSLVMGMEVFSGSVSKRLNLELMQQDALACANVTRALAAPEDAELAFMAGVLHDIGHLVLAEHLADEYIAAQRFAQERAISSYAAEHRLIGVSHAEIGAYLLGIWGLPYPVIEAIAHHHEPGRVDSEKASLVASIYVASQLVSEECHLDPVWLSKLGTPKSDAELASLRESYSPYTSDIVFAENE